MRLAAAGLLKIGMDDIGVDAPAVDFFIEEV